MQDLCFSRAYNGLVGARTEGVQTAGAEDSEGAEGARY